jgi:hypothetical protein
VRIEHIAVDIKTSPHGREALQDISKKAFGESVSVATPTTLAGRRVIRGADLEAIRAALAEESHAGK